MLLQIYTYFTDFKVVTSIFFLADLKINQDSATLGQVQLVMYFLAKSLLL